MEKDIIIYKSDDGVSELYVKLENEDVWLTQKQLVELYQTSKSTVSEHIKNIYIEEELTHEATVREIRTVQTEGGREVSRNLDDETIWLTMDQMSELFNKGRSTINEHILNIYGEGELLKADTLRKIGNTDFYTKPDKARKILEKITI